MDHEKKHVLVILDGAGDVFRDEVGRSPLGVADLPYIDKITSRGVCGKMQTLYPSLPLESLVAQLGMLGWDPKRYYPFGRASAELLATEGISLGKDDIAFRANFVFLKQNILSSYNANYILTEQASILVEKINSAFAGEFPNFRLYHNSDFRNTLVVRNVGMNPDELSCIQPHEHINKKVNVDHLIVSKSNSCRSMVNSINLYLYKISFLLQGGQANAIIPWSASKAFYLPNFNRINDFSGKAGIVGAMDFLKGIAIAGKIDFFKTGTGQPCTDFEGKGKEVIKLLNNGYGLVVCHINAPDEASHMGSLDVKIQALENIDRFIIKEIYNYFDQNLSELGAVAVAPDHFTNVFSGDLSDHRISSHSLHPVPFALWNQYDQDDVCSFNEDSVENGRYGSEPIPSTELMNLLTNHSIKNYPYVAR